ncbi:hypothetical protein SB861_53505, partial [Paraburkholderia sp. SIMBA_049]
MILSNRVFNGKRVVDADALTAALSPESQTQPPGDGQGTSNHGSASMSANELRQATGFMSSAPVQLSSPVLAGVVPRPLIGQTRRSLVDAG